MPLKITNPATQVGVLNNWADQIETNIRSLTTHSSRHAESIKQIQTTPSSGSVTSVGLAMPKEFVVLNSPVTSVGVLTAAWVPETPGYILQAPPPGLTSWQGTTLNNFTSIVGGGTLSVSQTPTSPTSLGLIWQNGGSSFTFPATWTQVGSTLFGFKAIAGTSPASVSYTVPSQIDGTAFISLFNGPAPSLVQSTTSNTNTGSLTLTNTSGNTLIVAIRSSDLLPAGPISIVISDSLGNSYSQIVNQSFLGAGSGGIHVQYQTSVWVAPNCLSGSNTLTWAINGPGSLGTPNIVFMEFGALATGNAVPFFAPLSSGSIPPINLAASGNGGVGGILPVVNGGTGANLAGSGGTGKFLRQNSVGVAIDVVQPTLANISIPTISKTTAFTPAVGTVYTCDTSAGGFAATLPLSTSAGVTGSVVILKKVSTDNNILTVATVGGDNLDGVATGTLSLFKPNSAIVLYAGAGWFVVDELHGPVEVAQVNSTNLTAAQSPAIVLYTAALAGQFRLSWNAKVTQAATTNSTLGPLTVLYVDPDGVQQFITAAAQNSAGTIETTDTGNTTTTVLIGIPLTLNCKAGSLIQYTTGYASTGATVMAYNLHIKFEAL